MLVAVVPEGFHAVSQDGWEEIEMAVDSGATDTVIGMDMISSVELRDGPSKRQGVSYEVANGERIPNLGEKKFLGTSDEGIMREITAQVCDVNKPLLSVRRLLNTGNRVVFDRSGSYIEDPTTGEIMYLEEKQGMYVLKLWTKTAKPDF